MTSVTLIGSHPNRAKSLRSSTVSRAAEVKRLQDTLKNPAAFAQHVDTKWLRWPETFFLTCISSSYIFMLRSLFVRDLRPRYTRDKCCTHRSGRKSQLAGLRVNRRGQRVWCARVCVLTPPLSMACRTPCRELREDSPGHVCLYNSRVARASSRLTSTSNTIPFSSGAYGDIRIAHYSLDLGALSPTSHTEDCLLTRTQKGLLTDYLWKKYFRHLRFHHTQNHPKHTQHVSSRQRTWHRLAFISPKGRSPEIHVPATYVIKRMWSHPPGSPVVPDSCGCSSCGTQTHPEWTPQWWSSPPGERTGTSREQRVRADRPARPASPASPAWLRSPHHCHDVKGHEVEPAPVAGHGSDSFLREVKRQQLNSDT